MEDEDEPCAWMSPDEWDEFIRSRKRAEFAITNKEFFRWVGLWAILMLLSHLNGRW